METNEVESTSKLAVVIMAGCPILESFFDSRMGFQNPQPEFVHGK